MHQSGRNIVWFDEVTRNDIPLVGGKGANLGEMTNAGIPVPPGFIVTADAYYSFLEETGITDQLRALLAPLDTNDSRQLQDISAKIQEVILDATMPADVAEGIRQSYREMGEGRVAVRSSATAEDLPEASFAGQQATFLNVSGEDEVVAAVQKCWASLFEARAIWYRVENGFEHFKVGIAVPVQRMVQSDASGVMFTVEPTSSDRSKITIEAVFGLGEMIVSGDVRPDYYVVSKEGLNIVDKEVKAQEWKLVRSDSGPSEEPNVKIDLTPAEQAQQKITDADIVALAKMGKRLEEHYQFPQDIEWAKESGELFIVQTLSLIHI